MQALLSHLEIYVLALVGSGLGLGIAGDVFLDGEVLLELGERVAGYAGAGGERDKLLLVPSGDVPGRPWGRMWAPASRCKSAFMRLSWPSMGDSLTLTGVLGLWVVLSTRVMLFGIHVLQAGGVAVVRYGGEPRVVVSLCPRISVLP